MDDVQTVRAIRRFAERLIAEHPLSPRQIPELALGAVEPPKRPRRPSNPQRKKAVLAAEYGQRCLACGCDCQMDELTLDHVIPRVHGGPSELCNLQLLCVWCNRAKGEESIDYRPWPSPWKLYRPSEKRPRRRKLTRAERIASYEPLRVAIAEDVRVRTGR